MQWKTSRREKELQDDWSQKMYKKNLQERECQEESSGKWFGDTSKTGKTSKTKTGEPGEMIPP